MELREGYKQTEVGVVPEDWEAKNIREIISLMTNGFVGTVKSHYTESDDGVTYIQGYNVEENSFNFHGIKKVTKKFHELHKKSQLQEGDLLTIQTGDIGVTTVVPQYLAGSNCHALIITRFQKNKVESKYFCYYFNSFDGRNRFKEIETGSTMKHINVGDMIQIKIPYPSLSEQTAIAQALSDTDELICSIEKLIEKKRMIKQGAMQQLLTGKKRLHGFSKEETKYKETEIGIIPTDWDLVSFGKAFMTLRTATYSRDELTQNDEVLYIHYGDIHTKFNHILDFNKATLPSIPKDKVRNYSILQEGDLIMVDASEDYTAINKSIEAKNIGSKKVISGLHTILLRDIEGTFANRFRGYIVSNSLVKSQFDRLATGMKVYGVSKNNLKKAFIPVPTKAEQTAIVQVLSDMDSEIEALEKKRDKYKVIKQGMMQELLTGRIRLV